MSSKAAFWLTILLSFLFSLAWVVTEAVHGIFANG